jgi:signal peptidase I
VPTQKPALPQKPADPNTTTPQDETLFEAVASICTVLVVGLFVISFVFQNFQIPSGSMEKTLLVGDHVLVDRITFAPSAKWFPLVHYREPQRNDIIVFIKPNEPDMILVKRVVGLPGDHIYLRGGLLYLNGVRQNEPQISMPSMPGADTGTDFDYSPYRDDFPSVSTDTDPGNVTATWAEELPHHIVNGELVVPPGVVFAMGDNRVESLDGRFWGFVPRENILGRPLFVYWSFVTPDDQMYKTSIAERIAFMFHVVIRFFADTRWSRTFRPIH